MNLTKETFIYEHFDHLNIKELKCLLTTLHLANGKLQSLVLIGCQQSVCSWSTREKKNRTIHSFYLATNGQNQNSLCPGKGDQTGDVTPNYCKRKAVLEYNVSLVFKYWRNCHVKEINLSLSLPEYRIKTNAWKFQGRSFQFKENVFNK